MGSDPVEDLTHSIRLSRRRRSAIERELSSHLEDSRHELELSGWSPTDARRESVARLGDPQEIARGFERAYRPRRRTQVGLAVAVAAGLIMGVYGIGGSLASATQVRPPHPTSKVVQVRSHHICRHTHA